MHLLTPLDDPEGLLSTVPAIATALFGVFAGDGLMDAGDRQRTIAALWAAGVIAMLVGFAWGRLLPINKNLWTSSFALFSAGAAAQALAICHLLVDTLQWRALVPPASRVRAQSAGRVLPVGRRRQRSDAMDRSVGTITEGDPLSHRLRVVAAAVLRGGGGVARLRVAYVTLWGVILLELHRRRIFIGV